jgi:N-glycosylase/DNA lyase
MVGRALPCPCRPVLICGTMKLQAIDAPDFDLALTLGSGQVFHWEKQGEGFAGTIAEKAVYAEQRGAKLHFSGADRGVIANYFALDHPLKEICASFPRDPIMNQARDFCCGLRIIRQPKWECLATFICSSMKQVAHIRQISHALRRRYGRSLEFSGLSLHAFPTSQRIAKKSEAELRKCALGYRAKNLLATARLVTSGKVNLENWGALPDDELRAHLCELPGVGAKVANCVLLFAYERLRAFPIDVWIERVLREKYFTRKTKTTSRTLREFAQEYFGDHGGYAQQYLFHHARMTKLHGERRAVGAQQAGHDGACPSKAARICQRTLGAI